jgi:hypothetical protein
MGRFRQALKQDAAVPGSRAIAMRMSRHVIVDRRMEAALRLHSCLR